MIFLVDIILLCPSLAVALAVDRSRYAAQDRLNVHSRGLGTGLAQAATGSRRDFERKINSVQLASPGRDSTGQTRMKFRVRNCWPGILTRPLKGEGTVLRLFPS